MALTGLTYVLEAAGHFHPAQTGFRPSLGTQDSLLLVRKNLLSRRRRDRHPRMLVAVDLRKAFDTVWHEAIIRAAKDAGITGRPLNFIRSFLRERTFSVRVGEDLGRAYPNAVGVPQGSILSPFLFNLVIRELAGRFDAIPEIGFTIYADDVTLWTHSRPSADQQRTLQAALDAIDGFLPGTGMCPPPEKTTYIVVRGADEDDTAVSLTFNGQRLTQANKSVRVLEIPVDRTSSAEAWVNGLRGTLQKTLHIIRRITFRMGGAGTDVARQLTIALVTSRVLKGARCYHLRAAQWTRLQTLHREALRVITGLPKHTRVEELYRYARLPPIRNTVEAAEAGLETRLQHIR